MELYRAFFFFYVALLIKTHRYKLVRFDPIATPATSFHLGQYLEFVLWNIGERKSDETQDHVLFHPLERLSSPSAETFGTAKVLEAKWASLDSSLLEVERLEMVLRGTGGGVSCSFIPRKHLYVEPIETPTTDEPTLIVR